MGTIRVSRNERKITFSAENAYDLEVLYEQLEQNDIAFTYTLDSSGPSEINAFLNQGDDVDALDKESYLDLVAFQYNNNDEEQTSNYDHYLYYNNRHQAQLALVYVQAQFDQDAELTSSLGAYRYVVTFTTDEEFSEEQAQELFQIVKPSAYDLNVNKDDEGNEEENEYQTELMEEINGEEEQNEQYCHCLYYDDRTEAQQVWRSVKTVNGEATLVPVSGGVYPYAITFTTQEPFSDQQIRELMEILSPDAYRLNAADVDQEEDEEDEDASQMLGRLVRSYYQS